MGKKKKGVKAIGRGAAFLGFLTTFSIVVMFATLTAGQNLGNGNSSGANAVTQVLCNVYNQVSSIIFVLALCLMVVGGAIYAGSHLLPAQTRGQFQGYAMGMVVGGVIGVIIVIAAPFIIGQLIKVNQQANNSMNGNLGTTNMPCQGGNGV
jgi:hypothetical protein